MPEKQAPLWRVGVQLPGEKKPREHLVRAHKRQQAVDGALLASVTIVAEVAEPDDIYRLAKEGVPITDATNLNAGGNATTK